MTCPALARSPGFTLIELTIVITIIGVLIGALAQGLTIYVIKENRVNPFFS